MDPQMVALLHWVNRQVTARVAGWRRPFRCRSCPSGRPARSPSSRRRWRRVFFHGKTWKMPRGNGAFNGKIIGNECQRWESCSINGRFKIVLIMDSYIYIYPEMEDLLAMFEIWSDCNSSKSWPQISKHLRCWVPYHAIPIIVYL